MSWPLIELGNLAEFINGFAFKPKDWQESGKKIIRIQNLTNPHKEYNLTELDVPSKYNVTKGDILVSWSATLDVFEWSEEDALLNQHIFKVVPDYEKVDKRYFKYALKKAIESMLKFSRGSTMKHVNRGDFLGTKIPLPPLEEQKRIAAILDKANSVRRKRQQAIDLADDFLRSVFLDMFGDPLVNSKKWQVQNLGELTTKITDGKHGDCEDEVGSGYYFISAKDVNHGRINYENTRQINKKEFDEVHRRTDLRAGDLVMVNTGATIGRVAIVMDDEKTCKTTFQKSVAIIKPKGDLLNSNFLKYIFLLRVKDFASVGSGSAIKNLLLSKMREFPIIVPPMELQRKFDRIVSHIESSSIRDSADSKLNDELFSSLSQKAFAGEL